MVKISDYVKNLSDKEYLAFRKYAYSLNFHKFDNDAVHNSFVKLLESESEVEKPVAYIKASIFNTLRIRGRERKVLSFDDLEVESDKQHCTPSVMPEYMNDNYWIKDAMKELQNKWPKTHQVMLLNQNDIANKDIALQLNIKYDTVKAHYRHAMLFMRSYYNDNVKQEETK